MTKLPRPREDLGGFQAYRAQQRKADVRLQANEGAEPTRAGEWLTPQELNEVLLSRYPSGATELRDALAERYRVTPDQLVIGNGSNEVLLNTFLVFGGHGRRTLLFQPTYSMHERLAIIAGGTGGNDLVGLPYGLTRDHALAAAAEAPPPTRCLTAPDKPTGHRIGFR